MRSLVATAWRKPSCLPHSGSSESVIARPIQVYMMDLLPTVPYYTGSLCAALNSAEDVQLSIGSIQYHLDADYFRREKLTLDRRLVDFASRLGKLPRALRRSVKLFEYLLNLETLLIRFLVAPPDIVHVQFLPMVKFGVHAELWFLQIVRALGIKIVYTVHNVLPQDSGERHHAAFARLYRLADRLICHDDFARSRLESEFGVDPCRISVIAHGPLLQAKSSIAPEEVKRRLGIGAHEPLVLWQGIVRPYKGVSFLLDAWKLLQSGGALARLAVVGDGDDSILRELREQVAALNIGSSTHLDFRFVSVAELQEYYSAADVVVYPYREITTSGALMTGLGHGKAIVATKHPAFTRILEHESNALLVDYGDIGGLANCLQLLIQNPGLRKRLGDEARKSETKGPQWSDLARQTVACYQSAMKNGAH